MLKDLEDRNFKRVFSRVSSDPIDDQTIELLSKYYSAEFLHRVQKGLKSGSSIDTEFPNGNESEEYICANHIQKIIKKYQDDYSEWLTPEQRKLLAKDSQPSTIQQLAL